MQTLRLNEKAGFYTPGPVEIWDKRGLFLRYIKPTHFNLPPGSYSVKQGTVAALEVPVEYSPLIMYPSTKPPFDPDKVKPFVTYTHDCPKMQIDFQTGEIQINPDWEKTLTTPEHEFVIRHELGHYFYDASPFGQYQCDRNAAQGMLECGFNPQQIALASHSTLCGTCTNEYDGIPDVPMESANRRMDMEMEMLEKSTSAKYQTLSDEDLLVYANLPDLEALEQFYSNDYNEHL